jgi:hypothetical protein
MVLTKRGVLAALGALGVILVIAVGVRVSSRPANPALPAPSSSAPDCTSTSACGTGFRCVVPGVCSRMCSGDADCPAGRRCAELRVMEGAESEGEGAPALAKTCVRAGPG